MQKSKNIDVAIIGGGPAGISAAIYTAYDGSVPMIFEAKTLAWIPELHINLLTKIEGFPGLINQINGTKLVDMYKQSLIEMNISENIVYEEIQTLVKRGTGFHLSTGKNQYIPRCVILCTGTTPKKLALANEDKFSKTNLYYFAYKVAEGYENKKVVVVGSRNSGSTAAKYLARLGAKVTIIEIKDRAQAKEKHTKHFAPLGINLVTSTQIISLNGQTQLESITIKHLDTNTSEDISLDALFVYIGVDPNNKLALNLGVETDDMGFVKVNSKQETNIPGVLAAGDLCGNLKHVIAASGQGATAAYNANKYLVSLKS